MNLKFRHRLAAMAAGILSLSSGCSNLNQSKPTSPTVKVDSVPGIALVHISAEAKFSGSSASVEILLVENGDLAGGSVTCGAGSDAVRAEFEPSYGDLPLALLEVVSDRRVQCRLALDDGSHLGFSLRVFDEPDVCGRTGDATIQTVSPTPFPPNTLICGDVRHPDIAAITEGNFVLTAVVSVDVGV